MIKNITIGSDPEFFIFKDDQPESSIGLINGTKHKPQEVAPGYGILKDNVLIEGNIPPVKTKEEFIANMRQLKAFMSEMVEPNKIVCADSAEFNEYQLDNEEARLFGCAPYFNAWTLSMNSPADLADLNFRVAGAHIHCGYTYEGPLSPEWLAVYITRAFDYFVIYPSRLEYNDPIRSKYYGDYGNFRIKPYGVEVRSLGGYFCQDKYLGWIYDQTIKTLEYCSDPENIKKLEQIAAPNINSEEGYKLLNINLEEQLYGNTISVPVCVATIEAV